MGTHDTAVAGGQGRSGKAVESEGAACWIVFAVAVVLFALSGCFAPARRSDIFNTQQERSTGATNALASGETTPAAAGPFRRAAGVRGE